MRYIVNFIVNGVWFLLELLILLMVGRAVLSWLPLDEDSAIFRFLYTVTEPLVVPVRMLLERFSFFRDSPLDISYAITMLLLFLLQELLPAVRI